jgi:flagellar motor switch protein FliM
MPTTEILLAEADTASLSPATASPELDAAVLLQGTTSPDAGSPASHKNFKALIDAQTSRLAQLPGLTVLGEQLAQGLARRLAGLTHQEVETKAGKPRASGVAEYLAGLSSPITLALIEAASWQQACLLRIDSVLLYAVLDCAFGGRRAAPVPRVQGRARTAIETRLIERLVQHILADLAEALATFGMVEPRLDRIEEDPRAVKLSQAEAACVVIAVQVALQGCTGTCDLVLPAAALGASRRSQALAGSGAGSIPSASWAAQLEEQIEKVGLDVEAVLHERRIDLSAVAAFAVGSTLALGIRADAPVQLRCGDVLLGSAVVGRRDDQMMLTIDTHAVDLGGQE